MYNASTCSRLNTQFLERISDHARPQDIDSLLRQIDNNASHDTASSMTSQKDLLRRLNDGEISLADLPVPRVTAKISDVLSSHHSLLDDVRRQQAASPGIEYEAPPLIKLRKPTGEHNSNESLVELGQERRSSMNTSPLQRQDATAEPRQRGVRDSSGARKGQRSEQQPCSNEDVDAHHRLSRQQRTASYIAKHAHRDVTSSENENELLNRRDRKSVV